MDYYKIETSMYTSKGERPDVSEYTSIVDELVKERKVEELKAIVLEFLTKNNKFTTEHFIWLETMSENVSHTGWGIPTGMKRSEDEKLFDECVFWRNEYIEMIIESQKQIESEKD